MKKIGVGLVIVLISVLVSLVHSQQTYEWQGPVDDLTLPPPGYEVTIWDNLRNNAVAYVDPGYVYLAVHDNDPEEDEVGVSITVGGTDFTPPTSHWDDDWEYFYLEDLPIPGTYQTPITFTCGEDSCHGYLYWKPYPPTATPSHA